MISRKWVAVTGHIMVFIPEGRAVPKLNLAQVSTSSLGFGQGRGSLFVSFCRTTQRELLTIIQCS